MEHALFISGDTSLERLDADGLLARLLDVNSGFSRIYFGSEFCEHALPDVESLRRVLDLGLATHREVTLVTPICTDAGLLRVRGLVAELPGGGEVVVNDWGVLPWVLDAKCTPVHGRALNRVSRDPRLDASALHGSMRRHFCSSLVHSPAYQQFLSEQGFRRTELDNVHQGYEPMPKGALASSLYYPFVYVSAMRYCAGRLATTCPGGPCPTTSTYVDETPLLVFGTASYSAQPRLPDDLAALAIDRLVHQVAPAAIAGGDAPSAAEKWNAIYARRLQSRGPHPFVAGLEGQVLQALPPRFTSLFEVGCGFGTHLKVARERFTRTAAVDLSAYAVDVARREAPNAAIVAGDFLSLEIDGTFDCVLDLGCGHSIKPALREDYASRVERLLSDRGVYIAGAFLRDARLPPAVPVFYVDGSVPEWGTTIEELVALFSPSLRLAWSSIDATDGDAPPRLLAVFCKDDASADLVDALRLVVPTQTRPQATMEPEAAPAHRTTEPEAAPTQSGQDVAAGLPPGLVSRLAALGVRVLRAQMEGGPTATLWLANQSESFRVMFRAFPSGQPHFLRVGPWEASYQKGLPVDDALRSVLRVIGETLPLRLNDSDRQ